MALRGRPSVLGVGEEARIQGCECGRNWSWDGAARPARRQGTYHTVHQGTPFFPQSPLFSNTVVFRQSCNPVLAEIRFSIASRLQVGAAVALTDREGAPWVLENIRGAVAANGLTPTPDDATPPPADAAAAAAAAAAGAASAADVIVPGGLHDDTAVGDAAGTTEGARVEGCENKRKGSEEGERPKEAIVHAGKLPEGTCSVRELSWGRVGPAEMKLAREQWCPQVIRLFIRGVVVQRYRRGCQVFELKYSACLSAEWERASYVPACSAWKYINPHPPPIHD